MILFFGTRPGKTVQLPLPHTTCSHCKQLGTLTISKTSNWFHLFWIRIFKISTRMVAECSYCKRAYYEEEFTEEMNQNLIQIQA